MKFRKRPVVVEAIRFDGFNFDDIVEMGFVDLEEEGPADEFTPGVLIVETLEGDMTAKAGDWIVKGTEGELYPVAGSIFDTIYEPVDE